MIDSGQPSPDPPDDAWVTCSSSYQELEALGVPPDCSRQLSADSDGAVAARAADLGDVGDSSPDPLGGAARVPGRPRCAGGPCHPTPGGGRALLVRARPPFGRLAKSADLAAGLCSQLPTGDDLLWFQDHEWWRRREEPTSPALEHQGATDQGRRVHPRLPGMRAEACTHAANCRGVRASARALRYFEKELHARVAAYRQYLRARASSREEEALLGAKMVGRWQSGTPWRSPRDKTKRGARRRPRAPQRLHLWYRCPRVPMASGALHRRTNPRDALTTR